MRGFWVESLRLASLLGAVAVGANLTAPFAWQLAVWLPIDTQLIEALSFFTLISVALGALTLVVRWLRRGVKQHATAFVNQVIGGALGLGSGVLLAGLTAWALHCIPWPYLRESIGQRSFSGPLVVSAARGVAQCAVAVRGGAPLSSGFFAGPL